jgi:CubicO group peptidase (beta-lactamase class C family)
LQRTAPATRGASAPGDFSSLDAFIQGVMNCPNSSSVPGLAIAIVQNGTVAYKKGYGVRDSSGTPVDTQTLFGVGSTSKAFTSLLLGVLEDEREAFFEAFVKDYLPGK